MREAIPSLSLCFQWIELGWQGFLNPTVLLCILRFMVGLTDFGVASITMLPVTTAIAGEPIQRLCDTL